MTDEERDLESGVVCNGDDLQIPLPGQVGDGPEWHKSGSCSPSQLA